MSFLTIPLKAIQLMLNNSEPTDYMPWYDPSQYPVSPGNPQPQYVLKPYRWSLTFDVFQQYTSSVSTRKPGVYDGQDIVVGQWIANTSSGSAWQIINITAKTSTSITLVVQDIYRYNTYKDSNQLGDGSPSLGYYVAFNVSDSGVPEIDPVPESGVSSNFFTNLLSRFEYINLQYDFPLYESNNNFNINDVIGTDSTSHKFVLASNNATIPVGRVTSISDTVPGWFTINPVQKITDFLDSLPGDIGDIVYTDVDNPGKLTLQPGGSQIYLKIRNNTQSITYSSAESSTTPGNVVQLNGVSIIIDGVGDLDSLVAAADLVSIETGVEVVKTLTPVVVSTTSVSPMYGEPILSISAPYATATINGITITFNIETTDAGYAGYTRAKEMAQSINNANIPNIVATTSGTAAVVLTNTVGQSITIVNGTPDVNGVPFSGVDSGSGLASYTPESTQYRASFIGVDSRPINFLDVIGSPVSDFSLISVENGIKACGMYIAEGIRISVSTVVANLSQLNGLTPYVGDQAYVIDSNDSQGNNVGEWSLWLYDGATWVLTSNKDSATTDAKSIESTILTTTPNSINIGGISTGRRISLITVEVLEKFNGPATLDIGYIVNNPITPSIASSGLMSGALIDLTIAGTYTTTTDILFGTDTVKGDVTITAEFSNGGATLGEAQIIVSYV